MDCIRGAARGVARGAPLGARHAFRSFTVTAGFSGPVFRLGSAVLTVAREKVEGSRPRPDLARRLASREEPAGRAVGYQRWNRLFFAHWRVPAGQVQASLPPGLHVDTHDGEAYLGVVPFFMERVRPAGLPPLPWLSWFPELNVRTYVHDDAGRPGVWFYSLDCSRGPAVALARRFFHLPYFHARMVSRRAGGVVRLASQLRREGDVPCHFRWSEFAGAGGARAEPGSLDFFLVERYTLFTADREGHLWSGRVRHAPYVVAVPEEAECSPAPARRAGFELEGPPASVLVAAPVDVEIFPLARVRATGHA